MLAKNAREDLYSKVSIENAIGVVKPVQPAIGEHPARKAHVL